MADEQPNGNVLRHRVKELEDARRQDLELVRFLSDKGQRNNEQIKVIDSQVKQLHEELQDVRTAAKEVPVLRSEVAALIDTVRTARNAFYTLGVGLIIAGVGFFYQAAG